MRTVRQGDVLLLEIVKLPATCTQIAAGRRVILAHGEATGHAHELTVANPTWELDNNTPMRLYEAWTGLRYLFVEQPCMLTHQEHGAIRIRPGFYEVIRQREYSPPRQHEHLPSHFGYVHVLD
jgi:hypothetical protein